MSPGPGGPAREGVDASRFSPYTKIMVDPGAARLLPFPSLGVRVRELRRRVLAGAGAVRVRAQVRSVEREHRRRLREALRDLRRLKPLCAPELRTLWGETLDSAILLLHLNARDFRGALRSLGRRARRAAERT